MGENPFFKYVYEYLAKDEESIIPLASQCFFLMGRFEKELETDKLLRDSIVIYDRVYYEQMIFNYNFLKIKKDLWE